MGPMACLQALCECLGRMQWQLVFRGHRFQMSTLKVCAEVSATGSEATPVPVSPQCLVSLRHVSFCSFGSQRMFQLFAGWTCSLSFSCSCGSKGSYMWLTHVFITADFILFSVQVQFGQCTVHQRETVNKPLVLQLFSIFWTIYPCGNLSSLADSEYEAISASENTCP